MGWHFKLLCETNVLFRIVNLKDPINKTLEFKYNVTSNNGKHGTSLLHLLMAVQEHGVYVVVHHCPPVLGVRWPEVRFVFLLIENKLLLWGRAANKAHCWLLDDHFPAKLQTLGDIREKVRTLCQSLVAGFLTRFSTLSQVEFGFAHRLMHPISELFAKRRYQAL